MKKVTFAIIGALLGIPLSYYFQSDLVQVKVGGSIGGYMKHIGDIAEHGNIMGNILLSMAIFAVVGLVIGYFMDAGGKKSR
ncbi:MAG TPA: hypothetical protein DIW47_00625 [Bacteroidetes bacterium]|nr:hypothetical protein [Bacteroidota bacterium]